MDVGAELKIREQDEESRLAVGVIEEFFFIGQKLLKMNQKSYPLYDVPYLVRDPNEYRMSEARHRIEVRNQAVVDDYFVARDKGASAHEARRQVAKKHGITPQRVQIILRWFCNEAKKRKKYDFLIKFASFEEH